MSTRAVHIAINQAVAEHRAAIAILSEESGLMDTGFNARIDAIDNATKHGRKALELTWAARKLQRKLEV